ncbi:MAG: gamma-glutamylcyclotransferase [Candidatus Omnitrophica bacterium]|nr:gamma-glutamylcyclotransferase [Candidatus Omnitrophota bacterium]
MSKKPKTTNLFVYGTLLSEKHFEVITGKDFPRVRAILQHYKKIDLMDGFPFIIKSRDSAVEGEVILGIDKETMKKLDRYEQEGELYYRIRIKVATDDGMLPCEVYIGNIGHIQHKKLLMGIGADAADRVEDHIEEKIEDFIAAAEQSTQEEVKMQKRITKELLGSTIEELIKAHFDWIGMPQYIITKNLEEPGIPTLEHIKESKDILAYADTYIAFAVRHMIFNQIEERVRRDFRSMVKIKNPYYTHTLSILLALHYMNQHCEEIKERMRKKNLDTFHPDSDYTDYARGAIVIAENLYNKVALLEYFNWLQENKGPGFLPLGAELEFSNLGRGAVDARPGEDAAFDSFYYFNDFDLMRRCWKLGGYIDDHRYITPDLTRTRGFLEYALGKYRMVGDLSKPVTDDPCILSHLIREAAFFAGVKPHSMHISIQQTYQPDCTKENDINDLLCLLLLGGDISLDKNGVLREKRIYYREIFDKYKSITFLRENRHYDTEEKIEKKANRIIEYQFPRLASGKDYEPLILALKGYQISATPRPLCLDPRVMLKTEKWPMLPEISQLTAWAEHPSTLGDDVIGRFIEKVEDGLMHEGEKGPAHSRKYIEICMKKIAEELYAMNEYIATSGSCPPATTS